MLFRGASFIDIMLTIPALLIAISFHEFAHGYIAFRKGDPTASNLGRLTLNPIKHLDPFGALTLLLIGFGWAKPVPVNPMYFKNPKKDMAIVGLAGPVSNVILAFLVLLVAEILNINIFGTGMYGGGSAYLEKALLYTVLLNIGLAVFNLIPIPPLDGSKIFSSVLPTRLYFGIMRYENYAHIILLLLLFTGILTPVLRFLQLRLLGVLLLVVNILPI